MAEVVSTPGLFTEVVKEGEVICSESLLFDPSGFGSFEYIRSTQTIEWCTDDHGVALDRNGGCEAIGERVVVVSFEFFVIETLLDLGATDRAKPEQQEKRRDDG